MLGHATVGSNRDSRLGGSREPKPTVCIEGKEAFHDFDNCEVYVSNGLIMSELQVVARCAL